MNLCFGSSINSTLPGPRNAPVQSDSWTNRRKEAYMTVAICNPAKPNTSTPTAALSGLAGTCLAK
jgi:hypothetical protein